MYCLHKINLYFIVDVTQRPHISNYFAIYKLNRVVCLINYFTKNSFFYLIWLVNYENTPNDSKK